MKDRATRQKLTRWQTIATAIVVLACAAVVASTIVTAVLMVTSGRGMETRHTGWLVEGSWIGFLTTSICAVVALLIGLIVRRVQNRGERLRRHRFEHGAGNPDTQP